MVSDLGQTTVMVTHDAHAAAIADRVLFLADGEIVRDLGPSRRPHDPRDPRAGHGAMIKVALKGLAGRKVRALLTALAVVIGVSMVSGTFVLTDTMQKAFDGIFEESYEGTDAVVNGKQLVEFSSGGRATVPASLLEGHQGPPRRRRRRGQPCRTSRTTPTPPSCSTATARSSAAQGETMGVGIDDAGRQFSPLKLKQGDWAHGDDEIVLDAGTASKQGFEVGDTIKAAATGPARPFKITGIATYGSVDSLGSVSLAIFDLPTAQALFGKEGAYDSISVKAAEGVSPEQLAKAIKPLLPKTADVKTGDAQAAADSKDINESLKFITYFLLGFAGIALFVGAFVILNTLSITVAQRSREFATLRTLGASRRQVMRSVVLEGLVVGLLASVLGLLAGLGIAKGMSALFASLGVDLPESGTVLAQRTIIVSLLTGTIVTLVASIVPALRATRVPPISAVREGSAATAAPNRRALPGLLVSGAALALIAARPVRRHADRAPVRRPDAVRRHRHARPEGRQAAGEARRRAARTRSRARTPSATRAARPPRRPR